MSRPAKYRHILDQLESEELYSPALIARLGMDQGLAPFDEELNEEETRFIYRRVRICLSQHARNHGFPKEGDGQVKIKGQKPLKAWFGWRWKGEKK